MSFHDTTRPKATFTINKIGDSLIRGKAVFNRNYTRGAFSRDKKLKSYPKCDDILRSENLLFVNFYRFFSFGTMSWRWILAAKSSILHLRDAFFSFPRVWNVDI